MPIITFCEECGAKHILYTEEVEGGFMRIQCRECGEVYVLKEEDIEVLSGNDQGGDKKRS